jgi:uncharacterized protein
MYDLIRKIHLYSGLTLLGFVLMCFVSGYVMTHHDWFPGGDPRRAVRDEPLASAPGTDPEGFSALLQRQFDLSGKRQPPSHMKDGSWKFVYVRPGVTQEAIVPPSGDRVRITRSEQDARGTLVGLHRLHGYGGGWLYDLWAIAYDVSSAAMVLFAVSGIYLWYKLTKRRLLGWALLAVSFGFATWTVLYLVNSP